MVDDTQVADVFLVNAIEQVSDAGAVDLYSDKITIWLFAGLLQQGVTVSKSYLQGNRRTSAE